MKNFLNSIGYNKTPNYKNKILYLMLLACIIVAGFFLTIYLIYIPFTPAIIVHITYILFTASQYYYLKHARYCFVKYSLILSHIIQVSLAVFLWFPIHTNFNLYYLMVPMVTFLIMEYDNPKERNFAISTSLIATFLFFMSELFPLNPMYETSASMNRFFTSVSILFISLPMIYIFFIFAKENHRSHKALEHLANTDVLTQLANRRVLFEQGVKEYDFAAEYLYEFTLIIFDIDHFKRINDQYGHPSGDLLLQKLTNLIMHNTRIDDTFARYGGEEFAILLRKTSINNAISIANKLLNLVREATFSLDQADVKITISIGVAQFSSKYEDFDHMMKAADKALYEAKNTGRDQVIIAK